MIKGAIDSLTRALLTAGDHAIPGIVAERAALREELREVREVRANAMTAYPAAGGRPKG